MRSELDYAPKKSILNSGEMVTFRLLSQADEGALNAFFAQISEKEAESLRHDVHDPEVIARWIQTLDYQYVMPLLAWDEPCQQIVGVSSLHRLTGVNRHIADVRIVVGRNHRKLGLGSALIKELIEIGTQLGLYFLKAEVLSDNVLAVKAFRQLGFEAKCNLEDYFMTRKRETRDVMLMLRRLRVNMEEDFFYVF